MAIRTIANVQFASVLFIFHRSCASRMQFFLDIWNQNSCLFDATNCTLFSCLHEWHHLRSTLLPKVIQTNSNTASKWRQAALYELFIACQLLVACSVFSSCKLASPLFHVVCLVALFGKPVIGAAAQDACGKLVRPSIHYKIQTRNRTHLRINAEIQQSATHGFRLWCQSVAADDAYCWVRFQLCWHRF